MITISDLQTALLDLLEKIQDSEIKLIIGGGFGIYLKTNHIRRLDMRTLLDQWPEPRSTNDLDLFLRPELLIESSKLKPLVSAIATLDYQVVPGAENYQFVKSGPEGRDAGSINWLIVNQRWGKYQVEFRIIPFQFAAVPASFRALPEKWNISRRTKCQPGTAGQGRCWQLGRWRIIHAHNH